MARVALARALLRRPELLVLDEPLRRAWIIAGEAALYELIAANADGTRRSHPSGEPRPSCRDGGGRSCHLPQTGIFAARAMRPAVVRDPAFIALFGPTRGRSDRAFTPIATIMRTALRARLSTPAPMTIAIMTTTIMGMIMDELFWRAVLGAAMRRRCRPHRVLSFACGRRMATVWVLPLPRWRCWRAQKRRAEQFIHDHAH